MYLGGPEMYLGGPPLGIAEVGLAGPANPLIPPCLAADGCEEALFG